MTAAIIVIPGLIVLAIVVDVCLKGLLDTPRQGW